LAIAVSVDRVILSVSFPINAKPPTLAFRTKAISGSAVIIMVTIVAVTATNPRLPLAVVRSTLAAFTVHCCHPNLTYIMAISGFALLIQLTFLSVIQFSLTPTRCSASPILDMSGRGVKVRQIIGITPSGPAVIVVKAECPRLDFAVRRRATKMVWTPQVAED
jgi:hypothetical protein